LIGDFNVTHREPAYAVLAAGLRDAHVEAGLGPGFTWRPSRVAGVPVGVLRIDYILTSPDFAIGSVGLDCTDESDHGRLSGRGLAPGRRRRPLSVGNCPAHAKHEPKCEKPRWA